MEDTTKAAYVELINPPGSHEEIAPEGPLSIDEFCSTLMDHIYLRDKEIQHQK